MDHRFLEDVDRDRDMPDIAAADVCSECGGEGYVVRPCHRCDGSGEDPFFTVMSVPCIDCGGARQLFYLCSHVLGRAGYSVIVN